MLQVRRKLRTSGRGPDEQWYCFGVQAPASKSSTISVCLLEAYRVFDGREGVDGPPHEIEALVVGFGDTQFLEPSKIIPEQTTRSAPAAG